MLTSMARTALGRGIFLMPSYWIGQALAELHAKMTNDTKSSHATSLAEVVLVWFLLAQSVASCSMR